MRTREQIIDYQRKYMRRNRERFNEYQRLYRKQGKKIKPFPEIHRDTDLVLKSIPHPFGSFEKASYVLFRDRSAVIVLYSFTTTCHNTEECVEIMKNKYLEIYGYKPVHPKYCSIYKVQNGIKKLIFKKIVNN